VILDGNGGPESKEWSLEKLGSELGNFGSVVNSPRNFTLAGSYKVGMGQVPQVMTCYRSIGTID